MSNLRRFFSNNILVIAGLILLFISTMIIWGNLIDYNIVKNGFEIKAKVIEAPTDCSNISSRAGFCKLEYGDKIFIVKAGKKFCHLVSQQSEVQMLTDENANKLLFPNEFNDFEFVSGFILLVISIFIIYKNYHRKVSK